MTWAGLPALRALRDCGTVSAPVRSPSYAVLFLEGLASATPYPQHEDDPVLRRLFRLTEHGRRTAASLPPLSGDRR